MRIRRGGIQFQDPFEGRASRLVLAGVEVRPPERLEDRRLPRLEAIGTLEDDRGLRVVPAGEERLTALEQLICRLALGGVGRLVG